VSVYKQTVTVYRGKFDSYNWNCATMNTRPHIHKVLVLFRRYDKLYLRN